MRTTQNVMANPFNDLNIAALFPGHNPRNEASRKLLKKLGFRYAHDEYYALTEVGASSLSVNGRKIQRVENPHLTEQKCGDELTSRPKRTG